ncbi:MAG: copper(I)-binding protein [Parasphingorhabdus sp.]|jgi:copper(I)-binding protein
MRLYKLASTLICLLPLYIAPSLFAHDYQKGSIKIEHPWARPLPPVSKHGAAFVSLHNSGTQTERLITISTDKAERVELHNHIHEDGLMKMRKVDDVEIEAGESVVFGPGGLHIMLMGLQTPLKEGESFQMNLMFESVGDVNVEVVIEQPGSNHDTID